MHGLIGEFRHALRGLAQSPGFTATAVVTLALGMGVNSVMFSLVDAVLFRPLPVERPDRLVRVGLTDEADGSLGGVSYPLLQDLARETEVFVGLAGFSGGARANVGIGAGPVERVMATTVSGNFFDVLGVRPAVGRLLGPQDDGTPGGHPVLVLSEAYWQRRFGGDPAAVGSTVRVNTRPFTVVGVAPRGFHGPTLDELPDVWIPLTMAVDVSPNIGQFRPFERRGFSWVAAVGRLQAGIGLEQAAARLNTVHARINAELKIDTSGDRYTRLGAAPLAATTLALGDQAALHRTSWILIGVTALVLAIACAVVAGLLLVRGERRQREVAVRCAIGASRGRIVRQLLVESFLLAGAGAALGVLLATWSADLLVTLVPPRFPLPTGAATPLLGSRALLVACGLSLACALAFGLLPARRAARVDLVEAIKGEGALVRRRGARLSLGHAFVITQVALSMVLLVGAGLLLRTLERASSVELGFDPHNALVVGLDVSKSGYDEVRGQLFYRQLLDDVRSLPGVRSAAIARHVPVAGNGNLTSVELTHFAPPDGEDPHVAFTAISPGAFQAFGIPLERGRDFAPADAGGPSRLIVNSAFAERFWPGRDPLAERVLNFGAAGAEVIGVAANAKLFSVREEPTPMIYVADFEFYMPDTNLVVRTAGEPRRLAAVIAAAVGELDPNVPVARIRTLDEHVGVALGQERAIAALVSAFALLALGLAAIGLYGVIAYATELRTREFGIRLALGASPGVLLRAVLGQGARLAVVGLVIGSAVAAGASNVLATLLFDVSPTDRVTFLAIAALLLAVALAASALPARRAAAVDPLQTLK